MDEEIDAGPFPMPPKSRRRMVLIEPERLQRLEQADEALDKIRQWCEAYPIDVFPDQDVGRARDALAAAGVSMGGLHAQWARHIMQGIVELAVLPDQARAEGETA